MFSVSRSFQLEFCSKVLYLKMLTQEKTAGNNDEIEFQNKKAKTGHEIFKNISSYYTFALDGITLGLHRVWKNTLVGKLPFVENMKILDAAGGTGDIAVRFLDGLKKKGIKKSCQVTVCDINPYMLEEGKKRYKFKSYDPAVINWVEGDAEDLPFEDSSFDLYVISLGIRNCSHPHKVLREAFRVLKPGGFFFCLDTSQPENRVGRFLSHLLYFYLWPIILFNRTQARQYAVETITQFPDKNRFKTMIEEAGFRQVTYESLSFGTCAIHSGIKPLELES